MSGFGLKSFTFILLIALLVWSSTFEPCNARRGKHWRQRGAASASLSKKKLGKSHHGSGSKSKSPPGKGPKEDTPSPSPPEGDNGGHSAAIFDVVNFGAKGDGNTDDTKGTNETQGTSISMHGVRNIPDEMLLYKMPVTEKGRGKKLPERTKQDEAFQAAWAAACKVEASTIVVPSESVFLVGPISFSGPFCQPNIVFQLDGMIIAPTSSNVWGLGLLQWLEFTKLRGITVRGKGTIDGRGSVWWQDSPFDDPIDDETKLLVPITKDPTDNDSHVPEVSGELGTKMPRIKPTALRFYGSFNVTVTGITIQNSPQCHLKFDNCVGVSVFGMSVSSPGDSLNTDGIHLQNSRDVLIHTTNLACGDDCISIQTGCSNVYIHNVNCGPGHGISIGGLGRDNTKACVSNITVRDIMMHNTMNGVRIKTWQGGSGSVQGVLFSNIQVSEVQLPIVIDQFYCDKSQCNNQTSAVALSGITYEKIRGTYTVKPVHFACSDSLPCTGVYLAAIELKPVQEQYHLYEPFCWQTYGELNTPTVPPIDCLQLGKPSSNRIQSDHDSCL